MNQNKDPKTVLRNKSVFNEIVTDVLTPQKKPRLNPKRILWVISFYIIKMIFQNQMNKVPIVIYTNTYNELYDNYIGSKDKYIKDLNDGLRFLTCKQHGE